MIKYTVHMLYYTCDESVFILSVLFYSLTDDDSLYIEIFLCFSTSKSKQVNREHSENRPSHLPSHQARPSKQEPQRRLS